MASITKRFTGLFPWSKKDRTPVEVQIAETAENTREIKREIIEKDASRDASISQLRKGYGELVETMQAMRTHMEEQSQRSDKVMAILEELPEVLRSLPEQGKAQTKILEAIHGHIEQQNETATELTGALSNLATATTQQERAMGDMQGQIAQSQHQNHEMMSEMSGTLGTINRSHEATLSAIRQSTERARIQDEQTRELFQKTQRHTNILTAALAILAITVIIAAIYIASILAQQGAVAKAEGVSTEGVTNVDETNSVSANVLPSISMPETTAETIIASPQADNTQVDSVQLDNTVIEDVTLGPAVDEVMTESTEEQSSEVEQAVEVLPIDDSTPIADPVETEVSVIDETEEPLEVEESSTDMSVEADQGSNQKVLDDASSEEQD